MNSENNKVGYNDEQYTAKKVRKAINGLIDYENLNFQRESIMFFQNFVRESPQKYKRVHPLIENDLDDALMNSQKSIVLEIINLTKIICRGYKTGESFFYGNIIQSVILMMDASLDSDIINSCKHCLELIGEYNEFYEVIFILVSMINKVIKSETIELLGETFLKVIETYSLNTLHQEAVEENLEFMITFYRNKPENKLLNTRIIEAFLSKFNLEVFLNNTNRQLREDTIAVLEEIKIMKVKEIPSNMP